jgi:quinohemoprotein ethanol dehydrogenase
VGWGGVFPLVAGELAKKSGRVENRSRVLTFALDGTAALPPAPPTKTERRPAPTEQQDPVRVAAGAKLYARYCGSCHGDAAHSGGLLPDLRHSPALVDDGFWRAVVEQGALEANGMIGFGKALGTSRLDAVRSYLIQRAQESQAAEPMPRGQ